MAQTTSIIHEENLAKMISRELNEQMTKAAEPIIQDALKKIEVEMRKCMAANLIALVEQNVSFHTNMRETVFTIRKVVDEQR